MKVNLTTDNLRKALNRLGSVPGVINSHLPTLSVIIEADDFGAKLRRTTAIASVSVTLEASVEEPGLSGVSYETFVNAVNAMGSIDTELVSDDKVLRIKSGKTKAELNAYPEDELLSVPDIGDAKDELSFSTNDLLKWFGIVQPAAASDPKETKFAGICLRVAGDELVLFSVDRRRAHQVAVGEGREFLNPSEGGKTDLGYMLINESVAALRKLLPETDTRVDLKFHNGTLFATVADVEAILPLGQESPPDMLPFLPDPEPAEVTAVCNRGELLRAVRTAAPLGFQDNRVISIFLREGELEGGAVEIVADNQSGAKLGHELDATVTGGTNHLRATGGYLADLVEAMEGEEITINYSEPKRMIYAYDANRMCILLLVRDAANAS